MKKERNNNSTVQKHKIVKKNKEILVVFRVSEELDRNIKATAHYCNLDVSKFLRTIVESNVIKPGFPFPKLPVSI